MMSMPNFTLYMVSNCRALSNLGPLTLACILSDLQKRLTTFNNPHTKTNLKTFVADIGNKRKVQSVLGISSPRSAAPDLIR